MQNYILVILSAVFYAVDFVFQKLYQQKQGTGVRAGLTFNAVVGLVTAFIFFVINKFHIEISLYAILMATCMGVCVLCYTILGFKVLKEGNVALYTMFLMTGGMVVPYVWGILFLDERVSAWRLAGLVVIIVAIVFCNYNMARASSKMIALCSVIFFLNGGCSVISKLCQTPSVYGVVTSTDFVCLTGAMRFLLCTVALLLAKQRDKHEDKEPGLKKVLWIVGCSAAISGIAFMLQLIGAAKLPATVLYPIVSGGSIVFSALAGIICFKEKPSIYQIVGVILCFVGTCLFL